MARGTSAIGGRYAIGEYRDLVTVQAQIPGGGDWYDVVVDIWAKVTPLSPWERLQAAQLQAAVDYRVAIRDCPVTVDATMRLVWGTAPKGTPVTLQIRGLANDGLDTVCEAVEAHT